MTSHVRHRRFDNPAAAFPTAEPGEMMINAPNRQLAVGDVITGEPVALLAIRIFSTTSHYAPAELMVRNGVIYRARATIEAGPFVPAQWDPISGASSTDYVLAAGDVMTGPLELFGDPIEPLHAATKQYVDNVPEPDVDKAYVDAADASKADKTYVDAADALKADTSYVDAADNSLADAITAGDAPKADKSYVDAQDALDLKVAGRQTTGGGYRFTVFNPYAAGGGISSGTFTPDAYDSNYQAYDNKGAHTIAAPAQDCAIDLLVNNLAGAGAITFSGFAVGANRGDALTTTPGHMFIISIRRMVGVSTYVIKALQ